MEIPLSHFTLDGLQLRQAIAGEGKPVLFLHGWGANIELVWPLAERLIPLGYRCYALDLPAFGESDTPPQAWTVFDYAQLVMHYLDSHQLERVYLFGHSFGGRLGLILGAQHPQRIIKMALADSAGIRPQLPVAVRWRTGLYKAVRKGLNTLGLNTLSEQLRHTYNARYGSTDFNSANGVLRQTFINVINQDLLDYAKRATPPTLLFWGDKDMDTPLWMGQMLEKVMPDAGLVIHAGTGHYSYLENLTDTVRVMDYFFKSEGA